VAAAAQVDGRALHLLPDHAYRVRLPAADHSRADPPGCPPGPGSFCWAAAFGGTVGSAAVVVRAAHAWRQPSPVALAVCDTGVAVAIRFAIGGAVAYIRFAVLASVVAAGPRRDAS